MKYSYFFLLTILFFSLQSCSDIFDCIIGRNATLEAKDFPKGYQYQDYYVDLRAEVKNASNDDSYYYYFTIYDLPEGLDYYSNGRTLIIEGVPQEGGTFYIMVHLEVESPGFDDYDYDEDEYYEYDHICSTTDSRTYTLEIQ